MLTTTPSPPAASLPHTPTTPAPRTPSAHTRRTPGANRLQPKSPYARRAFEKSRLLTPARERRRSNVREHRESDRDFLRLLSRQLAPTSEVPAVTPAAPAPPRRRAVGSDVVFYNPEGEAHGADDEEEGSARAPRFSYNPGDYDVEEDVEGVDGEAWEAKGKGRQSSRRSSVEAGRRAVMNRQSDFGFQVDDAFEDFGDASFGADREDTTMHGMQFEYV